MKHFYHQTFLFWVITKFLFAIAGIGSFFSMLRMFDSFEKFNVIANLVILIYALFLAYSAYSDIRSEKPNAFIRIVTGSISEIVGLSIFGLIVMNHTKNPLIAFLLSFWIILLGIYEWMQVERT